MMLFWHQQAREEVEHALEFYQSKQVGLEQRFLEALEDTTNRICRNPCLYRKVGEASRKCRLLHFPYALIFRQQADQIEIIAVMHLRKKPLYWKSRAQL